MGVLYDHLCLEEYMMKWHERLRHERQSRRWTQTMLAQKVGVNRGSVNRWENGTVFPHSFYREKLTTLFGINFEERDFLQDIPEIDHNTSEKSRLPSEGMQVYHE